MYVIKGMVQVLGTTYRVVQLKADEYTVVRIYDDTVVGGFSCRRTLRTTEVSVTNVVMRQIAAAALHQGRTSWLGRVGSIFGDPLPVVSPSAALH